MNHPGPDALWELLAQDDHMFLRLAKEGALWRITYRTGGLLTLAEREAEDWRELVDPRDAALLEETALKNAREGIDWYHLSFRLRSPEGETRWVSAGVHALRGTRETVYALEAVLQDRSAALRLEGFTGRQTMLVDILEHLNAQAERGFEHLLEQVGRYLGLSRVVLFEDTPEHTGCHAVYEWCGEETSSFMHQVEVWHLDYARDIPELWEPLREKGVCLIDSDRIPPRSLREFEREEVLASALCAVYSGGERYGFICFDECRQPRTWDSDTAEFLQLAANLVSAAVTTIAHGKALEYSRAAMETVLDNIPSYVYVAEPKTGEVAFANRLYRRDFPEESGALNSLVAARLAERDGEGKSACFELEVPSLEKWLEVQCSSITWVDGQEMLLCSGQDITEHRRHEEYIRRIAYVDHLTGLPNRYRCDFDLEDAVGEARRTGKTGYILFVDMDDFKYINDGYGHDYGDALLMEFAAYLSNTCLPGNKVFRFGGDEFVLLVSPQNAGAVHSVTQSLLERARLPWTVIDKSFHSTVSIGIAAFPDGEMGGKELLKNADAAMYEAKKLGKNSHAFYTGQMRSDCLERIQLESMLRESIARDYSGFAVHFQPCVEPERGRILGAEALLRWRGQNGRIIPPDSFIPLAEYLGLIGQLGRFVLLEACKLLRRVNEGLPDFTVSVNFSLRQMQQPDILRQIEEVLALSGANPKNLILEITENLAVKDLERTKILCGELAKMGVRVAMDNFGAGYASLSNLRDMPVHAIKISRSFIAGIHQDRYAHSFIRLVADFSHTMLKSICIVGVETRAQLDYCRYVGVDAIQGFFFYKPMGEEALCRLLFSPGEAIQ